MKSPQVAALVSIVSLAVAAAGWSVYKATAPAPIPSWPKPLPTPPETIPALMEIKPADRARAGEERRDNGLNLPLRWCPPGTFRMGSPRDRPRNPDESPAIVTLSRGYWLGQHEVTQGQWREVMGLSPSEQRARDVRQPRPMGDGSRRDHVGEGPDQPIYFVAWADAVEFCRRLTDRERTEHRLKEGWSYRLPTEAQWEYACRAGTTTHYPTGDTLAGTLANFDSTKLAPALRAPYHAKTTPVGRYPANAWGLRDMPGNVCEWTADGYAETLPGGVDRLVPTSGDPPRRVFRGGCWHLMATRCASAHRSSMGEQDRGSGVGFRVALAEGGSP